MKKLLKLTAILLLFGGAFVTQLVELENETNLEKIYRLAFTLVLAGIGMYLTHKFTERDFGRLFAGNETDDGRPKQITNLQELAKNKILEICKIHPKTNQKPSTPTDWKTYAEELVAEAKKNYGFADNHPHPKDKELINELAWIFWEASEKIGEFSGKSKEDTERLAEHIAFNLLRKFFDAYRNL